MCWSEGGRCSPGITDTSTSKMGSNVDNTSIPHQYVPASSSLRLSKVTVKVRLAGWSLMDTQPPLTSLADSLVSTVFHKHRDVHQNLLSSMNSSWYRHSMFRDPPMMPVTLLGPLSKKQPGKHNQLLVQRGRAGNTKDVGPARGPWGWRRWRQEAKVSSDPGKAEEGQVPSSQRRGCLQRREGPSLERTVCVFMGGVKRSSLIVTVEV